MSTPRPTRKKRTTARQSSRVTLPIGETADFFDICRVTWPEVALWVETVAGIGADSWRFDYYVRGWNVPEKVRAAKIAGAWPPVM